MRSPEATNGEVVAVDRVRCTGHGMCAAMVSAIELDEFGYPVQPRAHGSAAELKAAVAWCPAQALRLDRG